MTATTPMQDHATETPAILGLLRDGVASLLTDIQDTEFWRVVTDPRTSPLLVREIMKEVYREIAWYQPDVIEATIAVIGQFPRSVPARRLRTMLHHCLLYTSRCV